MCRHVALGTPETAKADHDRAIALLEQVAVESPKEPVDDRRLAIALAERAGWLAESGQRDPAVIDLQRAAALFETVLEQAPHDRMARANYVTVLASHAETLAESDVSAARSIIQRAIAVADAGIAGDNERLRIQLAGIAADLAMRAFDHAEGRRWTADTDTRASAWLAKRPDDPLRLGMAATVALNRGTMHLQLREHPLAIAAFEQGLVHARAATAKPNPSARQALALLLLRLADVSVRDHNLEAAQQWFEAALRETGVERRFVTGYPPLAALFDHPDLEHLVPKSNAAGK